jgi:hypothetical protein
MGFSDVPGKIGRQIDWQGRLPDTHIARDSADGLDLSGYRRLGFGLEHPEKGFGCCNHLSFFDRIAFFDQQSARHLIGINSQHCGDFDGLH